MSEEYKRKLYEYFMQDTPIKYESITPEQWDSMSKTLAGFSIQLNTAFSEIAKEVTKAFNGLLEAVTKALNK